MKLNKPKTRCPVCKMFYWRKHTCQKRKKRHNHILWQPNGFMDSSILQCEICELTFIWDICKQKYIEVKETVQ